MKITNSVHIFWCIFYQSFTSPKWLIYPISFLIKVHCGIVVALKRTVINDRDEIILRYKMHGVLVQAQVGRLGQRAGRQKSQWAGQFYAATKQQKLLLASCHKMENRKRNDVEAQQNRHFCVDGTIQFGAKFVLTEKRLLFKKVGLRQAWIQDLNQNSYGCKVLCNFQIQRLSQNLQLSQISQQAQLKKYLRNQAVLLPFALW